MPAPLAPWAGDWQAAEPFFRDAAAKPIYQAIHDLRPEYSVEEIEALFVATADVGYRTLLVGDDTLTFSDSAQPICTGRYERDESAPTTEGKADFVLIEQTAGDCRDYQSASTTDVIESAPEAHFHIVTANADGPLSPPPWNPSVWTPTTTASFFAKGLEASIERTADSLPAK